MKYYTNLEGFNAVFLVQHRGVYGLPHASFYLSLLPKEYKDKLMSLNTEVRMVFKSIYEVEDEFCDRIEDADFYVLPFCDIHTDPDKHILKYRDEINYALKLGKKLVYFLGTDVNMPVKISRENGLIFRTSGFLSEAQSNVYGCPTVNLDLGKPKNYKTKLSISFTGWAKSSGMIEIAHGQKVQKFDGIREDIINELLLKIPDKCDFILRDDWGPKCNIDKLHFYKNMSDNLYCLCVRGFGNFSFRLGETLMAGRIPILIDTECILPFIDEIPWDKNCVRIKPENFHRIPELVQEYHDSHTEEELIDIQKQNREIWEQYFIPKNTYKKISSLINNFNRL